MENIEVTILLLNLCGFVELQEASPLNNEDVTVFTFFFNWTWIHCDTKHNYNPLFPKPMSTIDIYSIRQCGQDIVKVSLSTVKQ